MFFSVQALNEGRRVQNLVTLKGTQNDQETRKGCKNKRKKNIV
jgi:hypothetical protein